MDIVHLAFMLGVLLGAAAGTSVIANAWNDPLTLLLLGGLLVVVGVAVARVVRAARAQRTRDRR